MKCFALLVLLILTIAFAAPVIQSQPTISGGVIMFSNVSSAGTKPTAAPLVYDNFESDTAGQPPAGWTVESGSPVVSTARPYAGTKSFLSNNPGVGTSNHIIKDLGTGAITNKMYLSADIFIEKNDTNSSYQWKVWRWSGYPNVYYVDNYPDTVADNSGVAINAFWSGTSSYYTPPTMLGWYNSGSFVYSASGVNQNNYGMARNTLGDQNTWFRFEQVITPSSSAGAADGSILSYTNGVLTQSWTGLITQSPGDVMWRYIMIANALENTKDASGNVTTAADMKFYWDNVYIDNSVARVELCDSGTWATRTHCEIQPAITWGDTITANFNQGSFQNTDTVYAYITDPAGNVSAASPPISLAVGGADTTAPTVSAISCTSGNNLKSIDCTVSATDDTAVTDYCVTTDSTSASCSWQAGNVAHLKPAASGTLTFNAFARDAAGNVSSSQAASKVVEKSRCR